MAASLVLFGVVYFAVIAPGQNTANQALKTGLAQGEQVIKQSKQQLNNVASQASAANSQAGSANSQSSAATGHASTVTAHAKSELDKAAKLAQCVAAAGTDTGKIQACQAKF
jgi:hypothetical protein